MGGQCDSYRDDSAGALSDRNIEGEQNRWLSCTYLRRVRSLRLAADIAFLKGTLTFFSGKETIVRR
jgi:hypothetical protein